MKHADKLEMLDIDALVPYARNARTHSDDQVAAVARSIERFGFTNPVLIDGDGGIVAGHGRVMAAKRLGIQRVPCLRVGWLSDAEKRAYVLADNKLAELAGWDDDLLAGELCALQADDFDLSLTGFAQDELDDLLIEKTEGKTDRTLHRRCRQKPSRGWGMCGCWGGIGSCVGIAPTLAAWRCS